MKFIRKAASPPQELTAYCQQYVHAPAQLIWRKFKHNNARRDAVRTQLREDQRGLCAYCEISLVSVDESVEHFIPRSAGQQHELAWNNLLLCCCGGEKPLPEDIEDAAFRYDQKSLPSCGRAKWGSTTSLLNPLTLPASTCIFRYSSETGAILADDAQCQVHGINPVDVENTIGTLGLCTGRLNRARIAILNTLLELWADNGSSNAFSPALAQELASQQIPSAGNLPAFFTTIRWALGDGAEAHLQAIGFNG